MPSEKYFWNPELPWKDYEHQYRNQNCYRTPLFSEMIQDAMRIFEQLISVVDMELTVKKIFNQKLPTPRQKCGELNLLQKFKITIVSMSSIRILWSRRRFRQVTGRQSIEPGFSSVTWR